jgi:hypothetical protein
MASIPNISSPNLTFPKQNLSVVTFPLKRPSLLQFPSQPLCLCLNSVSDDNHNNTNNNNDATNRRWDSMLNEFLTSAIKQFDSYMNSLRRDRAAAAAADDRGVVNDEEWDWNRWRQYFDQVDDQERLLVILKVLLRYYFCLL